MKDDGLIDHDHLFYFIKFDGFLLLSDVNKDDILDLHVSTFNTDTCTSHQCHTINQKTELFVDKFHRNCSTGKA